MYISPCFISLNMLQVQKINSSCARNIVCSYLPLWLLIPKQVVSALPASFLVHYKEHRPLALSLPHPQLHIPSLGTCKEHKNLIILVQLSYLLSQIYQDIPAF